MPKRGVLERVTKRSVTGYLMSLKIANVPIYWRMPVPFGYDKSGIDFEGCLHGLYFGIEAKSPDEDADLTPRQRDCCLAIYNAGGKVFIISGEDGLLAFRRWAEKVCACFKV